MSFILTAAESDVFLEPPSLLEWPESLTRPRAGTGRFVCQAEGFPTPRISWLKNGEPVRSNGRIKMYNRCPGFYIIQRYTRRCFCLDLGCTNFFQHASCFYTLQSRIENTLILCVYMKHLYSLNKKKFLIPSCK